MSFYRYLQICLVLGVFAPELTGCSVKVEAPDKPIEVNVNVKIQHELKIAKEAEKLAKESGLYD